MNKVVKKHIVILCSRLDLPGGIEKAIIQLSNLLVKNNYKITLLVLDETGSVFFPVDPQVDVLQVPLFFGITEKGNTFTRKAAFVKDVLLLGKQVKALQADVVIATEYPFAIAAVLAGLRKKHKVITWEHHHMHELSKSYFWKQMFRLTYPRSDAVVCLNPDEMKLYCAFNDHTVVIPNFIQPGEHKAALDNKLVLTIGRLTHVKGTDLIVDAAKILFRKYPDWKWKIIGNGDMKTQLDYAIKREKLESNFIIDNVERHALSNEFKEASIYVCTSRNESFGMTIMEAMQAGLPCVSFDCETGPRNIISPNVDGLLAEKENPQSLADAVSVLISDENKRKEMGGKAFENIRRFSPGKALKLWEDLINE